jgi:hypothetical protein
MPPALFCFSCFSSRVSCSSQRSDSDQDLPTYGLPCTTVPMCLTYTGLYDHAYVNACVCAQHRLLLMGIKEKDECSLLCCQTLGLPPCLHRCGVYPRVGFMEDACVGAPCAPGPGSPVSASSICSAVSQGMDPMLSSHFSHPALRLAGGVCPGSSLWRGSPGECPSRTWTSGLWVAPPNLPRARASLCWTFAQGPRITTEMGGKEKRAEALQ